MSFPKRMKFGVFMAPFHRVGENPTLALERDLELLQWLDTLGFDEAYIGEHHSAGWETIASPELFMATAAERQMRAGPVMTPPVGLYDEFCARFPYSETEDQATSIDQCIADLESGTPMDRLVCGDVGFGKTEVALRAAFIAAFAGKQVAIVAPTTLLCRQHFQTFSQRFADLPVRIAQLSRLVPPKEAAAVRLGVAEGAIDIIIGTHALLSKSVAFKDLGLLVIDEEQHFGVAQKERLKALKADVHVLTLTATPIPRTLQMALSGVRDLSIIATPPVDRLAVRTFVLPYDPVVVREAIMREHYRGGQIFYICPRIEDLDKVAAELRRLVPEIKMIMAHGKMPARRLEDAMTAFYDGAYELLLSTSIIESGLDIPTANTLIVHRADMYGLAQLYQLRGRVGRSKIRAYAYYTVPAGRLLKGAGEKRPAVVQTPGSLGAGLLLASHDLPIRGAGNLSGAPQHGPITTESHNGGAGKEGGGEVGARGLRFDSSRPGCIESELMDFVRRDSEVYESYLRNTPMADVGRPEDVAHLARFLIGQESRWVTGVAINVDGGHALRRGPDFGQFVEPAIGKDALTGGIAKP